MSEYRQIINADDVTPEVLKDAEDVLDGWFSGDGPIDWDGFIDRLEGYGSVSNPPYEFPEIDNPGVRKIQRHIRQCRRNS